MRQIKEKNFTIIKYSQLSEEEKDAHTWIDTEEMYTYVPFTVLDTQDDPLSQNLLFENIVQYGETVLIYKD